MTTRQHVALTVRCSENDYVGTTGPEMQAHAQTSGHHAFYVTQAA